MSEFHFHPVGAPDHAGEEDQFEDVCRCDLDVYDLTIDDGSTFLECPTCKNGPPPDMLESGISTGVPIRVKLSYEKDPCACLTHPDRLGCDCDGWFVVTPILGGAENGEKNES